MSTNYEDIIPQKILFNIREVEEMGQLKQICLKNLLHKVNLIEFILEDLIGAFEQLKSNAK